jgi:nitrogen fixation NifU-like protein
MLSGALNWDNCQKCQWAFIRSFEQPIIRWMYNEAILDHFRYPRNAGVLADATVSVEAKNPVCGDILLLSVRVEDGRIAAVRFKAQGCVASIAASSVLTELLEGKTPTEARAITVDQISGALGGLPPATFHAAQLAVDAVKELLNKLG